VQRVVGDDPDGLPCQPPEADDQLLGVEGLDLEEAALVDERVDDPVHVVGTALFGRDDVADVGRAGARLGCLDSGRRFPPVRREVREPSPGGVDGRGIVGNEIVARSADGRMHARAPHLLEARLLADDLLRHPGRAEVHRRVALHHEHDVAERRDVRAAGRRRAEETAHLRHPARQAHLVGEDAPGTAASREQLDLVRDARPGRVDEVDDRELVAQRGLGQTDDLLDGAGAPRPRLDRGIVGHHTDRASVDPGGARHDPVGGQ
jgi:hypothetical protein